MLAGVPVAVGSVGLVPLASAVSLLKITALLLGEGPKSFLSPSSCSSLM